MLRWINFLQRLDHYFTYKYLFKKMGINIPIQFGAWSIGHDDVIVLANEIFRFIQKKNIKILEFGSGVSTFVILSCLENNFKEFNFISLEAEKNWFDTVKAAVNASYSGINSKKKFTQILKNYSDVDGYVTFNLSEIISSLGQEKFDFIFVDAPPDTNGENVRMALCYKCVQLLSEKGVMIVHDTNRIDELYLFEKLKNSFHSFERKETNKGICVYRFKKMESEYV